MNSPLTGIGDALAFHADGLEQLGASVCSVFDAVGLAFDPLVGPPSRFWRKLASDPGAACSTTYW
jgi:hypothetical protein